MSTCRRILGVGGLVALLSALAAAQPACELSGPDTVSPGGWARLTYTASGGATTWVLYPDGQPHLLGELNLADGGSAMLFLADPQTQGRTLIVLVVADPAGAVAVAVHEITVGAVPPVPDPDDPDIPDPPDGEATAVVVVFDEDTLTPRNAEVIAQLRKHFDSTPVKFFALDVDATDENGQRVAPSYVAAAGVDPPCVVVYSESKVTWRGKLPATAQELLEHAD